METILVDGQWNLKRNFKKRQHLIGANGKLCGGTYGFLDSLKSVMNRRMPDRVLVAWDGFNAGKLRYNIYKPYKAKRKKDFESEARIIATEGFGNPDDSEKFSLLSQKIDTQMYLEELFVRQVEEDYIEADDIIAYYILGSKDPNEHIYIFSRDKDFHQLVSERVSLINPDSLEVITIHNFKEKMGYTHENALLFKCFEGDSSDEIEGVKGITANTLLKYFPDAQHEKYTYKRLVDEAYAIQESRINGKPKKKRLDTLDKIIQAEDILYRNAKLMNLRKPFLNQDAVNTIDEIRRLPLDSGRSIDTAMQMFARDGFNHIAGNSSLDYFFGPFYNLMAKEKEYQASLQ
jgi:5'-3' exonuclease